jgi:hypothetical protein
MRGLWWTKNSVKDYVVVFRPLLLIEFVRCSVVLAATSLRTVKKPIVEWLFDLYYSKEKSKNKVHYLTTINR